MRIIAVVQARMGSSRLPNKAMALIEGMPMTWHVVERLRHSTELDDVVLSIPSNIGNDALRYLASKEQIPYFAGAERDLLSRTLQTARAFEADAVVRITADCPLADPRVTDNIVWLFRHGNLDYVSNVYPLRTYPAGIAVEVYRIDLLDRLDERIRDPRYREYFMVYLWQRGHEFKTDNVTHSPNLSGLRWTVDYGEDLEFVRRVYAELYGPDDIFVMRDVLDLVRQQPGIAAINAGIAIEPLHGLEGR